MRALAARILGCVLALATPVPTLAGSAHPLARQASPPRARVELTGPLSDVTLDCGAAGATVLVGELLAGETRVLEVPLSADAALLPPNVTVAAGDPQSVRVERLSTSDPGIDAALAARPRPPVGARAQRPALASVLIVAAGLLIAALSRERPRVAVGASLAAALGAALLPPLREARVACVRVYETDSSPGRAERWLAVQSAADAVEVDPARPFALEIEPRGARLQWTVELTAAAPTWRVCAPGARLTLLASFDPANRLLERDLNAWASFSTVWGRSSEGSWQFLGPWGLGQPRPDAGGAAPSAPPPPGWLAAGLPPGREALAAAVDSARAPSVEGWTAPDEAWLRRIGPGLDLGEPSEVGAPADSPGEGD